MIRDFRLAEAVVASCSAARYIELADRYSDVPEALALKAEAITREAAAWQAVKLADLHSLSALPCPACDGVGTVTDWQPEDIEVGGVEGYEFRQICEVCDGTKAVTPELLTRWEHAMNGGGA